MHPRAVGRRLVSLAAAAALLVACPDVDDGRGLNAADAALAPRDATPPLADAGAEDAALPDAAPQDAGLPDAGPPDAGPQDAGRLVCADADRTDLVFGGGQTAGLCPGGDCLLRLDVRSSEDPGGCDAVALEICGLDPDMPCVMQEGLLTPAAHAEARDIARALAGAELRPRYGCPDCDDQGAGEIRLRRAGVESVHVYELPRPPDALRAAHDFVQGVNAALYVCMPGPAVRPGEDCRPR